MTNDLKQLLNDSAAHAPAEPHSVNDIVRSAQRAHRSHTAKLVGGSALALALVAGVGYAALARNGSDDAQPVRKLEHGPVKTIDRADLKDARTLVAGKDYDVLAEFPAGEANSTTLGAGWSPDDLIVVKKDGEFVAISGRDGAETVLSGHQAAGDWPIGSGEGHVVWFDGSGNRRHDNLLVEDVSTGQTHELPFRLDGLEVESMIPVLTASIEAGRIWAMLPADEESTRFVSVSAPLDGSSGFRREIDGTVSEAAAADGKLVWTEGFGRPLMVRDLDSGEESEITGPPLARDFPAFTVVVGAEPEPLDPETKCRFSITEVTAEGVLTTPECDTGTGGYTSSGWGTVWSLVGGPTVRFDGLSNEHGGLANNMVLFQRMTASSLGTYAYRFDTGEILDLGEVAVGKFGRAYDWPVKAAGDRMVIPSPEKKGHLALVVLK